MDEVEQKLKDQSVKIEQYFSGQSQGTGHSNTKISPYSANNNISITYSAIQKYF